MEHFFYQWEKTERKLQSIFLNGTFCIVMLLIVELNIIYVPIKLVKFYSSPSKN